MDSALASALIDSQCPQLAPSRVMFLGEGCDSTAFTVNDQWVFRFPKNGEVERQLAIEARILPKLAERLPVAVPIFRFQAAASPAFGRRFVGYPKLPGEPALRLPPDAVQLGLTGPLARALSALHAFPLGAARSAGVPDQPLETCLGDVRTDALDDLRRVREIAPDAPVERWRALIEAGVDVVDGPRVLVHNDFAAEHVLVDPLSRAMTGIIDWSDIAISDPAVDFAGLFHWGGEPLARGVLAAYDGDLGEEGMRLARYLGACRGAMDIAFGLDRGRPEYIDGGLRALTQCAGGVRS